MQADISNKADGWSLTADWDISDTLAAKGIFSDRSSSYTSGLDDDSVEETLFQYPEYGWADQKSAIS